jgi:hypothetical protein
VKKINMSKEKRLAYFWEITYERCINVKMAYGTKVQTAVKRSLKHDRYWTKHCECRIWTNRNVIVTQDNSFKMRSFNIHKATSRTCQNIKLEICTTDQSLFKYTLQPCLGANTTSTICYNLLKLRTQKLQALVTIIQLEISKAYKSSIDIQKIYLGANAMSTIYYGFLKPRAQNLRVLVVTTKLEIFMVHKFYTTKQEFYQGINAMSATHYNSYLNSNKNE